MPKNAVEEIMSKNLSSVYNEPVSYLFLEVINYGNTITNNHIQRQEIF